MDCRYRKTPGNTGYLTYATRRLSNKTQSACVIVFNVSYLTDLHGEAMTEGPHPVGRKHFPSTPSTLFSECSQV